MWRNYSRQKTQPTQKNKIRDLFTHAFFISMAKTLFGCILFLSLTICSFADKYTQYPWWYNQYNVLHYNLDVEIENIKPYIRGNCTITAKVLTEGLDTFRFELSSDISLDSVFFSSHKLVSSRRNNVVAAVLPFTLHKEQSLSVQVYYHGEIEQKGFFSPLSCKSDSKWQQPVTWTLSEPYGAKYWFPCKQDARDKADSVHINVTVPSPLKAGSNGLLTRVVPVDEDHLRYEWKTNYPIPYYLISLCVSDFREYNFYAKLASGDSVFVQNYIYNQPDFFTENKEQIDQTSSLLNFFSSTFCEYPFIREKYGHCMAPMGGGMENQTMTTLSSFDFTLIAHEMAHQWFGDMVSCANYHDIWLNEGFASYSEYLALDKLSSHQRAQNWLNEAQRIALREPEGSVFIDDISESNQYRIFSYALTYKKGATLLHMLRYELNNDDLFFKVLRNYLQAYKYSSASLTDFISVLNSTTQKNYSWFFDQWFYGKGYPIFDLSWNQVNDTLQLLVSQKPSAEGGPFFRTPFDIKLKLARRDSTLRFNMDSTVQYFRIPMSDYIRSIEFDPQHWLLKKVSTDKVPVIPIVNNDIEVSTPFVSQISVTFKKHHAKKRTVKLTDCSGTIYLNEKIRKKEAFRIETAQLPAGTYLLYIIEGRQTFIKKVIKPRYPEF
jgi:aminopeptidase N